MPSDFDATPSASPCHAIPARTSPSRQTDNHIPASPRSVRSWRPSTKFSSSTASPGKPASYWVFLVTWSLVSCAWFRVWLSQPSAREGGLVRPNAAWAQALRATLLNQTASLFTYRSQARGRARSQGVPLEIAAVDDRERQRAQDVSGQRDAAGLQLATQTFFDIIDTLRAMQANFVVHGLKRGRERVTALGVIGHRVILSTGVASAGSYRARRPERPGSGNQQAY